MITVLNMSHLQYYNYEGVGKKNKEEYWYSQAEQFALVIASNAQVKVGLPWDQLSYEKL